MNTEFGLSHDLTRDPSRGLPRLSVADFNAAWGATLPAELLTQADGQPLHEKIEGLVMREVNEPDLFRRFFGGR